MWRHTRKAIYTTILDWSNRNFLQSFLGFTVTREGVDQGGAGENTEIFLAYIKNLPSLLLPEVPAMQRRKMNLQLIQKRFEERQKHEENDADTGGVGDDPRFHSRGAAMKRGFGNWMRDLRLARARRGVF